MEVPQRACTKIPPKPQEGVPPTELEPELVPETEPGLEPGPEPGPEPEPEPELAAAAVAGGLQSGVQLLTQLGYARLHDAAVADRAENYTCAMEKYMQGLEILRQAKAGA
jgi:hypothetical protein